MASRSATLTVMSEQQNLWLETKGMKALQLVDLTQSIGVNVLWSSVGRKGSYSNCEGSSAYAHTRMIGVIGFDLQEQSRLR